MCERGVKSSLVAYRKLSNVHDPSRYIWLCVTWFASVHCVLVTIDHKPFAIAIVLPSTTLLFAPKTVYLHLFVSPPYFIRAVSFVMIIFCEFPFYAQMFFY